MDTTVLRKRTVLIGVAAFIGITLIAFWTAFAPVRHYTLLPPTLRHRRPSVTLRQGSYIGRIYNRQPRSIEEFRGIPYGLSTAREGRFSPPLPVLQSKEYFDASNFGWRCPAGNQDAPGNHEQDEDCLNLNIMRPEQRPLNKKLPVLIHFYGGSFNFGSSTSRNIGGLIGYSTEAFIAVTFNYRIGALGFLPSSLTEKAGLLNVGLKDQVLLLKWVRDNIAEFGGDPNDVTVMGVSAGAHGVRFSKTTSYFYLKMTLTIFRLDII